jgi:glycosyltransferase involved in cell wall biosynthesis
MSRVSAVVPAYNAASFLGDALDSLLKQTYRDLEIVVVDDGSSDGTAQLVRDKFPGVILLQQQNLGVAAARNLGIARATGKYIASLDADDRWMPTAVERLVQCLDQSNERVGLAYAWSAYIDEHGQRTGGYIASLVSGAVWSTLLCHNFLGNASATLTRKSCFDRVGLYDPAFRQQGAQGCEDWDLYLRIARQFEFRVVPELLIEYRKVPSSMSSANPGAMERSHQLLWQRIRAIDPKPAWFLEPLSAGSFCQYLASEARQRGDFSDARHWYLRAVQCGHICTLARPDFYGQLLATLLHRSPAPPRKSEIQSDAVLQRTIQSGLHMRLQSWLHHAVTMFASQHPQV